MVAQYVEAQWQPDCLLLASSHIAGHRNSMKPPLLCFTEPQLLLSGVNTPFVTSSPRRAGRLPVQERHKYACALSASQESQWRAPSGLENMASKIVSPTLLNVDGSICSCFPATTYPPVAYPGAVGSTPERGLLLVLAGGP